MPGSVLHTFDQAVVAVCEAIFPPSQEQRPADDCVDGLIVPQPAVSRCIVPKLIVFDVDKTILRIDEPLANVQQSSCSARTDRQAKFVDWPFLSQLCAALCQRQHKIGVATFCEAHQSYFSTSSHVADELVELLDGVLPFCRSYLQDDAHIVCGCPPRRSTACKNEHLQHMLLRFGASDGVVFDHANVILIDDSLENVVTARAAGFGAFCCSSGLTREWFATEYELQYALGLNAHEIESTACSKPDAPIVAPIAAEARCRRHVPHSLSAGAFDI